MSDYKKVNIYLKEEIIEDIENILKYKEVRDLLDKKDTKPVTNEEFIVGCVCYYLRKIKAIEDLSGINELGRPYQLKNRIKELLEQKNISQQELAKKTGIGASNISLIVKNKNQPSLDYWLRIWIALDCPPIDWMLYREVEE